jgi:2Fe-2S ferredoxin
MPLISFKKTQTILTAPADSNLMTILQAAGIPVASSCNGDGVCAKCKITILEGSENLSPENEIEIFLREKNEIPIHQRISCQTKVFGDIKIDATYW